jgi:hypothetical protein
MLKTYSKVVARKIEAGTPRTAQSLWPGHQGRWCERSQIHHLTMCIAVRFGGGRLDDWSELVAVAGWQTQTDMDLINQLGRA